MPSLYAEIGRKSGPFSGNREIGGKSGPFKVLFRVLDLLEEARTAPICTSEPDTDALPAVARYKELAEVERGFGQLKDVLALRPIDHRVEPRVKAHIFVAALALFVQTFLGRRLQEAGVALSAAEAFQAVQTIRHVTFRVSGEARSGVSAAGALDPECAGDHRVEAALPAYDGRANGDVVTNRESGPYPPRIYDGPG
jgi:hypothetical protein